MQCSHGGDDDFARGKGAEQANPNPPVEAKRTDRGFDEVAWKMACLLDYWTAYPEKVRNVTQDEVDAAARKYLDTDHDVVVFVGNIEDFTKDMKKFGASRVIPLKSVDFGSPRLGKTAGK